MYRKQGKPFCPSPLPQLSLSPNSPRSNLAGCFIHTWKHTHTHTHTHTHPFIQMMLSIWIVLQVAVITEWTLGLFHVTSHFGDMYWGLPHTFSWLQRIWKNFKTEPSTSLFAFFTCPHPTFISCFGINLGDLGCLRGRLWPNEKTDIKRWWAGMAYTVGHLPLWVPACCSWPQRWHLLPPGLHA